MAKVKKTATLQPRHKQALYLATAVLWATGAIWLLAQAPLWMRIHGAAAMVFLMAFGALWLDHIPLGWTFEEHRPSGVIVTGACGLLILTGWGLYYAAGESLRVGLHWVHVMTGLFLPILITVHVRVRSRREKAEKAEKIA